MVSLRPRNIYQTVAWIVLVAIVYIAAAKIGFSVAFSVKQVTAVWPPAGIAIAALVLAGYRVWPGVFIGALVANAMTGEPVWTAVAIAAGNTIGPLFGAWMLRLFRFDPAFSKTRDVLIFVAFASLLAMTITASNGVAQLMLAHLAPANVGETWALWWTGDAMGVLLFAPCILTWFASRDQKLQGDASASEIALLIGLSGVVAGWQFLSKLPFAFPLYPLVVWSAFRASARITTTTIVAVAGLAVYGTIHDLGPFRTGEVDQRLMELVTFTSVLSISGLILSAMTTQRRNALAQMKVADRRFQTLAETVPQIVWTADANGNIDWVNQRWFSYSGQRWEEASPSGWQPYLHADDATVVIEDFIRMVREGTKVEREVRLRRNDGVYRWFLVRGEAMRDDAGRIVRWYGTCTDVDEQHRTLDRTARIAKTLQSAFLPETLPSHPKLQFDALYLTAGHEALIGGDWYDAFRLPDDRFIVSIGDVAGHGLSAAVGAGRIRQSIVATALDVAEPEQILGKVNRLIDMFDGTVATALVALVDTERMTMRYASAGHPAPIISGPHTPARPLEYGSLPLGVAPDTRYETHEIFLESDSYVLFYTDGITEIKRDIEGSERELVHAMNALVEDGPAPHCADQIRAAVLGDATPTDDAVLMVMRVDPSVSSLEHSPLDYKKEWSFHSSHSYSAHSARREVMNFIERFADAQVGTFDAELIVGEILANTVEHAPGLVNMQVDWSQASPVLTVIDAGPGLERFVATLPEDAFTEDGRGLFLVKALAKEVSVESARSFGTKMRVVLPLVRK